MLDTYLVIDNVIILQGNPKISALVHRMLPLVYMGFCVTKKSDWLKKLFPNHLGTSVQEHFIVLLFLKSGYFFQIFGGMS